jgi:GNAT superfamily N-acetyltransferase
MEIILVKAELKDAGTIHAMQIKSFMPLLDKYQDYETSPANEPPGKVIERINQSFTDYYIVKNGGTNIGGIRVVKKENKRYRVSPVFILPEYQGKGIAQKVFQMIEKMYDDAKTWELETILQEPGNCHLYEKIGYIKTGKTETVNTKMTLVFYEKQTGK